MKRFGLFAATGLLLALSTAVVLAAAGELMCDIYCEEDGRGCAVFSTDRPGWFLHVFYWDRNGDGCYTEGVDQVLRTYYSPHWRPEITSGTSL